MNKSFPQSPTASSETSETQSINDEPITINKKVSNKQTKKGKEPERERPPWKPVSIATPSKADKNALLKAKILDATRRALISQRIAHTWTQTDPIPTKDEQVETDGSVTIKKESPGGFILTQTIGLTTDEILMNEVSTQTAMPKTSLSFGIFPYVSKSENRHVYGSVDNNILRNARTLQDQSQEMKKLEENLWKSTDAVQAHNEATSEPVKRIADDTQDMEFSDDSLSENGEEDNDGECRQRSNDNNDRLGNDGRGNFLNAPTLTSWTGFDSNYEDEDGYDLPELPRQTISEGYAPWQNFKDIIIGNRLANMHLSPLPARRPNIKRKSVTWSDAQHEAVSELMFEATALLDVFDNVAMLLGPELDVKLTPNASFESLKLPESKWQPVLEKSSKDLDECLKLFQPHVFSKSFEVDDLSICEN